MSRFNRCLFILFAHQKARHLLHQIRSTAAGAARVRKSERASNGECWGGTNESPSQAAKAKDLQEQSMRRQVRPATPRAIGMQPKVCTGNQRR
ncbi:conserved protein of unknown function [Pseudomonas marincola]|uniref:Uncharacterized protein n=1 Tax=Pseudomonas marincola TaxID=437900 RepID=A0A653E6Q2_9PSED|nr:conserved protein of unknown function [Pseudomonas marincola]